MPPRNHFLWEPVLISGGKTIDALFISGVVFALAVAFSLAGKDIPAKYLGGLDKPAK
ncbi:MAG: hypothetical protein K8I00_04510 [Candidatus Omnitrophica bacterium]|nr:hypothetical protein [Candidatus Omnitrophota bacterium]